MKITIFRSLFNTDTPYHIPIEKAVERIKKGKSKAIIDRIRSSKEKSERDDLKVKNLPAILFSGVFSERNKSGLTSHSGGMVIRSEEHTSELQSRGQLVCRLLLETTKKSK